MPGILLQTNGERLDERTARWSFYAADVFPDGYGMFCRSAEVDRRKAAVFGQAVLKSPDELDSFLRLCREVPELPSWLAECIQDRSTQPLRRYLPNLPREARETVRRLLRL